MTSAVRRKLVVAGLAVGLVGPPAVAIGHDIVASSDGGKRAGTDERHLHQHGATAGHLPAVNSGNVSVVSKLAMRNVEPEKIADVGVSPDGNTAYLAAWGGKTCRYNGVHVVDIADPAKPREVSFIQAKEGSAPGEGIQAIDMTTRAFNGRLLVTNNEICKDKAGFGGMNLYDVSNPKAPTPLAEGIGDTTANGQGKKTANETHSVFAWDAGEKAYAVIVDNEEGADVDIFDITNPRKAVLAAEYDLDQTFPQIRQDAPENLNEVFLHDMVVKQIGGRQVMTASYWDGGYVNLDVTDPKAIKYLGDTDFTDPDREAAESGLEVAPEGNAHQSEFTADNRFIIGADEDFAPYALQAKNLDEGTPLSGALGSDTRSLAEGERITGQAKFVGRGCPSGDPAVPAGDGSQIAVVERGVCSFTEKLASVTAAGGYRAALVFNRQGTDACDDALTMTVAGSIPAFGVATRAEGFAIFGEPYDDAACRGGSATEASKIAVGATGDTLTFASQFDGWGYVRLFENENGKMTELDTYAIDEAHDPEKAEGFGDLSVHEVATSVKRPNRGYLSYYSGGLRVVDIEEGKLVEKARFIDQGGSNLWGVEVFQDGGKEFLAASDRDKGLYILQVDGG
jgi:hypothetical protein